MADGCTRIRVIFWFRRGFGHWKGLWCFRRNVTYAVEWSLCLGGIEIRKQIIGTW